MNPDSTICEKTNKIGRTVEQILRYITKDFFSFSQDNTIPLNAEKDFLKQIETHFKKFFFTIESHFNEWFLKKCFWFDLI